MTDGWFYPWSQIHHFSTATRLPYSWPRWSWGQRAADCHWKAVTHFFSLLRGGLFIVVSLCRDLYITGAGIKPTSTVPICLDLGTNTQKLLDDSLYLGVRRKRPNIQEVCACEFEFLFSARLAWTRWMVLCRNSLIRWKKYSLDFLCNLKIFRRTMLSDILTCLDPSTAYLMMM